MICWGFGGRPQDDVPAGQDGATGIEKKAYGHWRAALNKFADSLIAMICPMLSVLGGFPVFFRKSVATFMSVNFVRPVGSIMVSVLVASS